MSEDSWFKQPWEDDQDEADPSFLRPFAPSKKSGQVEANLVGLPGLEKLLKAHDVLGRLEAILQRSSQEVRKGFISRFSLSEASGYLSHQSSLIHHRDLALREVGLTGSYLAAQSSGRLRQELIWTGAESKAEVDLPEDVEVETGLLYARQWGRLSERNVPLSPNDQEAVLSALEKFGCRYDDPYRLKDWLDVVPSQTEKPGLQQAAWVLGYGLPDRQREDKIDIAASLVAAIFFRQSAFSRYCPMPFWSAPTRLLNILGRQGGRDFDRTFYECVTEAALLGLRQLDHLSAAEAKIVNLPKRGNSNLAAAALLCVKIPVVTAAILARELAVTTRTGTDLIERLTAADFIKDITGRRAWRAYSII